MKIAICDDAPLCRTQILELAEEYAKRNTHLNISVSAFTNADDLLEKAEKIGGFDIYILDILMPDMNGIELGVCLRESGFDGKIIYLTSSEEYVFDSFKARPFDYLRKPVTNEALFPVLDEATLSVSVQKEKSIIVKTKNNNTKLTFDSILYAELCQRSIVYHLIGGKTVETIQIRTTFAEAVQELLQDSRFTLCGKGVAANLHHMTMVDKNAVMFRDGSNIFLSKKACAEVRSAWNDFWLDGEGIK